MQQVATDWALPARLIIIVIIATVIVIIDHIIAEKAATLITCADPNAECAHCMNVDSEFVASVLTKRLLDRTPKARNTLLKWG